MSHTQIKIMKLKPQLTDDEIRSHMDFDKLLRLRKDAANIKSTPKWARLSAFLLSAIALVATVVYTFNQKSKEKYELTNKQKPESTQPATQDSMVQANPPIIPDKEQERNETAKVEPTQNEVSKPKPAEVTPVVIPDPDAGEQSDSIHQLPPHFTEAEPIDGYPALYEYFNRELKYPVEAVRDSIDGTVIVSFEIDVNGLPREIKVMNSLGESFDKESIRVIENMPKWKAATIDGEATPTRLSIPLTFKILK